ncbi:MAG: hypothetical protein ABSA80_09040 [Terriglobales bacterium]|jgi:hypothetical protein
MSQLNLKPTHAAVKNYYAALHQLGQLLFVLGFPVAAGEVELVEESAVDANG